MKRLSTILMGVTMMLMTNDALAQSATGADFLKAYNKADCNIVFDVNAEGEPFRVKWGMDTAWDWDWNVTRGIDFYGKGLFETGRVSFQPIDLVTTDANGALSLSARQKKRLDWRIELIKRTGTKEVNLNCDHEVLFKDVDENGNCYDVKDAKDNVIPNYTGKKRYAGKPEEWVKLIKATAQYCEKKGLKVVSVSPFNESDFTDWHQYYGDENAGMKDFLNICKLIRADEYFKDIRICGGNTLNCDRALPWYNYLKEYLDEGNTHQLAGSFDTYADFFKQVKADGKVATADELHNVGEALVGANYGMETGIWWGFDSKARGQFMHDSNEGVRIGYGENRAAWTDGAVYRNEETGEVHGYLGSSERQATTSTFAFVSKGRDVYFNGDGPTRMYVYEVPGGTGYQKGQKNAERLFDITWGEDVAPGVIDGTYQIMNAAGKKMLTWNGSERVKGTARVSSGTTQRWKVYPSYTDGDMSYWFIDNVTTTSEKVNLNVLNNNLNAGAEVICYNAGHGAVEQWYLKYAKDGYYYIISRLNNKYMHCNAESITLKDAPTASTSASELKKYLWRFQPTDSKAEQVAPKEVTELAAKQRSGSVELSWTAPESNSIYDGAVSYIILRGETPSEGEMNAQVIEWNTIARNVTTTSYIDNAATAGRPYTYKVVAVDYAGNRSKGSEMVSARVLEGKALLCQLQFDGSMKDNSANQFSMALCGKEAYGTNSTVVKSGNGSFNFDGSTYGMIPCSLADQDEMTISMWVRYSTSNAAWMRVFDFGNGEDQYMFFTPNNGSEMRFVMKNGGEEQILTNGKKLVPLVTGWKHVAITLKPLTADKVQAVLYVDGEAVAQSDEFTIKPSDIKPSLCFIARSMFNADPYFKGYLDDFRIYNYALSADEVKGVMDDKDEISKDLDTAIEEVKSDGQRVAVKSTGCYDMSGRKVSKPSKGLYINEGRKVMVK